MKFSDEEQEKVLEAHAEHNKGTMSRVIGSLFWDKLLDGYVFDYVTIWLESDLYTGRN